MDEPECRVPSPSSAEASIVSASDETMSNGAVTALENSEEEVSPGEEEIAHEVRDTSEDVENRDVDDSEQQEQEWEDILGNGQLLKKVSDVG